MRYVVESIDQVPLPNTLRRPDPVNAEMAVRLEFRGCAVANKESTYDRVVACPDKLGAPTVTADPNEPPPETWIPFLTLKSLLDVDK